MNNTIYMPQNITVRLYDNPKFGNSIGRNRTNTFVYNGSVELTNGRLHVDLATIDHVSDACHVDSQHMPIVLKGIAESLGYKIGQEADFLVGQLKFVQDGERTFLDGGLVLNTRSMALRTYLRDDQFTLTFDEGFSVKRCQAPKEGKRSPALIGSNFGFAAVPVQPPTLQAISRANAALAALGLTGHAIQPK